MGVVGRVVSKYPRLWNKVKITVNLKLNIQKRGYEMVYQIHVISIGGFGTLTCVETYPIWA
jgi:hypothetical protein